MIALISNWKEGTKPKVFNKAINNVGNVEENKMILKLSPNFNAFPVIRAIQLANNVYNKVYRIVTKRVANHKIRKVKITAVPLKD